MHHSELEEIANKWLEAFSTHNLSALLRLYDEKVVHYSPRLKQRKPETQGFVRGKKELRAWWQDAFDRYPGLRYEKQRLTPGENWIFIEYRRIVDREPDSDVLELLEVNEHGLIHSSKVYLM